MGSDSGYLSNSADTALVLKALGKVGYAGSAVQNAITFLQANQNADGGWSAYSGPSLIQPTSYVLAAFSAYRGSYPVDGDISSAINWLASNQNPDGGFGNSPSTYMILLLRCLR